MTFDIVTIWHFVLTIWHLTMWKFAIWQFDIVDIWHCWHLPLLTSDIVDIWHWQAISQWLMDQPPLSIKHQDQLARLEGRLALCPSCPGLHRAPSPMSSMHALLIFISTENGNSKVHFYKPNIPQNDKILFCFKRLQLLDGITEVF